MIIDVRLEPTSGLVAPQAMIVPVLILSTPRSDVHFPAVDGNSDRHILLSRTITGLAERVEKRVVDILQTIGQRRC